MRKRIICFIMSVILAIGYMTGFDTNEVKAASQAESLVSMAKSQLGIKERSSGSDDISYNDWYYGRRVNNNGVSAKYAWCAVFVSWCANQAGIPTSIIPKTANTTDMKNRLINSGGTSHLKGSGYTPKCGDIIFFGSNASQHVGIVEYSSQNTVYYIDGNNTQTNPHGVHYSSCSLSYSSLWGFVTPNYASSGSTSSSQNNSADVGTNFYAYIINTATWLHATTDGGNVNVRKLAGNANQIWYFERQSDSSYKITSCASGGCMEVHNFESANGTNVEMNTWNGNTAQRWFISGSSGAYKFKAACGNNVLDMSGGSASATDGTILQMWEDNGTDAQKFQIWKLDRPELGIPTPSVTSFGDDNGNNIKITWNSCSNATGYDVRIYDENGKDLYTYFNIQGTSCVVSIPSGNYKVDIAALNSRFNYWKFGPRISFQCSNNLGTNFYAYLINTATWLHATTDGGNVNISGVTGNANQVWYFERQSDNSYKITSCLSGGCMEVHNFESANGTNVEMNTWNGNTAQRWFISGSSGAYKFKAVCGSNVLDVAGGAETASDGTNLQMWEENGTDAQKFQIWRLDQIKGSIQNAEISLSEISFQYDSTEKRPSVTVKTSSKTLVEGTDYQVTYLDNTDIGTASVVIVGKGNYTGEVRKTFTIVKADHTHSYESVVIAEATCQLTGVKRFTCSVCGDNYTDTIPKKNHTAVTDQAVAATCTSEGKTEGSHCKNCGAVIKPQQTIPKTEHIWNNGEITVQATAAADGIRTYTCISCGETKTEKIPAFGQTGNWEDDKKQEDSKDDADSDQEDHTDSRGENNGSTNDTDLICDLEVGDEIEDNTGTAEYEVISVSGSDICVEYAESIDEKARVIKIPDTIKTEDGIVCKVTAISKGAFKNNRKIKKVLIGNHITIIGAKAFYGCRNLTSVQLGESVTVIGNRAFYGCRKLKKLNVKTELLSSGGLHKKAFQGIPEKTIMQVPKDMKKSYEKLLCQKGLSSKNKIQ